MEKKRENPERTPRENAAAYSDAYFREAPQNRSAYYGYSPAQCYARASGEDASGPEKKQKNHGPALVTTAFLVCILLAVTLGSGGMFLLFRSGAASEEEDAGSARELYEIASSAAMDESLTLNRGSSTERDVLTAEEIYDLACSCTVGVTAPGPAAGALGLSAPAAVRGSGIVLNEDGYILTNYHVIREAYENGAAVGIMNSAGREQTARIVGVETASDLAVLKTEMEGLAAAEIGDSSELAVGQVIYTVGNPLGELSFTMTSGIVSSLDRNITTRDDISLNMFQIDAAVNSGSGGGPVFNVYGQVIGIVTAKYTMYGTEGLGFAIPADDACEIACELAENGYLPGRVYLGLKLAEVSPGAARYYDMVQGVYIYAVREGSSAEDAGLCPGDIITALDDTEITDCHQLVDLLRQFRAGDSAEMTVWRDQEYITVTVVFDEELPGESGDPFSLPDGGGGSTAGPDSQA